MEKSCGEHAYVAAPLRGEILRLRCRSAQDDKEGVCSAQDDKETVCGSAQDDKETVCGSAQDDREGCVLRSG